jgi:hypothetical protein
MVNLSIIFLIFYGIPLLKFTAGVFNILILVIFNLLKTASYMARIQIIYILKVNQFKQKNINL